MSSRRSPPCPVLALPLPTPGSRNGLTTSVVVLFLSGLYSSPMFRQRPQRPQSGVLLGRLALALRFRVFLSASAVVCIPDVLAVELGLLQPFVDNIVDITPPHGCRRPRRDLGRVFGKHFPKVFGTFSAVNTVSLSMYPAAMASSGAWRTKGIIAGTGVRMTAALPSRHRWASRGSEQRLYAASSMTRDRVRLCGDSPWSVKLVP